jgi:hypothetical protein
MWRHLVKGLVERIDLSENDKLAAMYCFTETPLTETPLTVTTPTRSRYRRC